MEDLGVIPPNTSAVSRDNSAETEIAAENEASPSRHQHHGASESEEQRQHETNTLKVGSGVNDASRRWESETVDIGCSATEPALVRCSVNGIIKKYYEVTSDSPVPDSLSPRPRRKKKTPVKIQQEVYHTDGSPVTNLPRTTCEYISSSIDDDVTAGESPTKAAVSDVHALSPVRTLGKFTRGTNLTKPRFNAIDELGLEGWDDTPVYTERPESAAEDSEGYSSGRLSFAEDSLDNSDDGVVSNSISPSNTKTGCCHLSHVDQGKPTSGLLLSDVMGDALSDENIPVGLRTLPPLDVTSEKFQHCQTDTSLVTTEHSIHEIGSKRCEHFDSLNDNSCGDNIVDTAEGLHDDSEHCSKLFTCNVCDATFNRRGNLEIHERRHRGEKPFICELCQSEFVTQSCLNRHKKIHSGQKPHICATCGASFTQINYLKSHEKIHGDQKPHQCPSCDSCYRHKASLLKHLRVHTGERPYACSICDARFITTCSLKRHLVSVHDGSRPYACPTCGSRHVDRSSMRRHHRTHTGEKPYACSMCSTKFTERSNLVRHERMHTGERPFICVVCDARFTVRKYLTRHQLIHTQERPYRCDVCGVGFSDQSTLRTHDRMHTGERPYQCRFCESNFSQKGNLRRHERRHTGEKPYSCSFCDVKYRDKGALTVHERIHTGAKPYSCRLCGAKFRQNGHRIRHEKRHRTLDVDIEYDKQTDGSDDAQTSTEHHDTDSERRNSDVANTLSNHTVKSEQTEHLDSDHNRYRNQATT